MFLVSMTLYSSELYNLIMHFECYLKHCTSSDNTLELA